MKTTVKTRKKNNGLVNICTNEDQKQLFKAHIEQYEKVCIEYLDSPNTTQEEADKLLEIIQPRIELLKKAIELIRLKEETELKTITEEMEL